MATIEPLKVGDELQSRVDEREAVLDKVGALLDTSLQECHADGLHRNRASPK